MVHKLWSALKSLKNSKFRNVTKRIKTTIRQNKDKQILDLVMVALCRREVPQTEAVVRFLWGHRALFNCHHIQNAQIEPRYLISIPFVTVIIFLATRLCNLNASSRC
jgi:hypothetical protein